MELLEVSDRALNPETLGRMTQAALSQAHDPEVVFLARGITRNVASKNYRGELQAIYNWVVKNIRYRQDPYWIEWVQSPKVTLGLEVITLPNGMRSDLVAFSEDCDGHSTLIASLAMALGHGAGFETVCASRRMPEEPTHVYALAGLRGPAGETWIPLDSTMPNKGFGWRPMPPQAWNHKTYILANP